VIRLVEKAQNESPPSQQFIEGFERAYAKIIVILGSILGFYRLFSGVGPGKPLSIGINFSRGGFSLCFNGLNYASFVIGYR
jgi:cation transport ATPase